MASGTDTHNALFQQDSSRFTFFSECLWRNRALPLVPRSWKMLGLYDVAYLAMPGHQSIFFSYALFVISDCCFLINSCSVETPVIHSFYCLCNKLIFFCVDTQSTEFSFSKWGKKHYIDPSHSLIAPLEISSFYFLLLQTLVCLFPQHLIVSNHFLFPCSCTSKWSVCPE